MSSTEMNSILENSKELDRLRAEQEVVLTEINKLHKKLQTSPEVVDKPGDNSLARLKGLYIQAKDLAETEVRVSNILVAQLDALLPPGPPGQQRRRLEGNEQKRKQKKNDSESSRGSPSTRNQLDNPVSLKGEQVAARVTTEESEKDEYIVVKVIHFDKEAKEFEVLDEEPGEDEEGGGQSHVQLPTAGFRVGSCRLGYGALPAVSKQHRKFKVPLSHIIPFPKRNDPSTALDFQTGKAVLAVYPGTTALYKATVVNPIRKRKTDDYLLEFDDDEGEDGSMPQWTVPFHNVVALPEGHRQGRQ